MSVDLLPAPSSHGASPSQQIRYAIRQRRRALGLSQGELAEALHISRKWVSELETGVRSPSMETVLSACSLLGLHVGIEAKPAMQTNGASIPGSFTRANEDAWSSSGSLVWVLDGATQPLQTVEARSAADYVRDLSVAIQAYSSRDDLTLARILQLSIADAAPESASSLTTSGPRDPGPAATVAMIRASETQYEWLVLGDAAVVIPGDIGVSLHTDRRLGSVATAPRARRREARSRGASAQDMEALSMVLYREELSARNVPGGYWVAADKPDAALQAITGSSPRTGPALLVSDGMLEAIGPSALWPRVEDAYADWVEFPPEVGVARAREFAGSRSDRKVDDATLVVVR